MSLGNKIREWYKLFNVNKRSIWGDYVIDRKVFLLAFGLVLVLLGVVLLNTPAGVMAYAYCPLGSVTQQGVSLVSGCDNPFYDHCSQDIVPCDVKVLPAGSTFGEPFKIPFLAKNFLFFSVSIMGLAFFYNHLKYNLRGKK